MGVCIPNCFIGLWTHNPKEDYIKHINGVTPKLEKYATFSELKKTNYPSYFKIFEDQRSLISNDVYDDNRLHEFTKEYFPQNNIKSLLDAPIFFDEKLVAILCCESVEKKDWSVSETMFIISCADYIGRIYERERRRELERDLRDRISFLEVIEKKQFKLLEENNISLKIALDAANAGKWDWNLKTNKLILNDKWASRLGYELSDLEPHLDTWKRAVHPDDLKRVLKVLNEHLDESSDLYEAEYRMIDRLGNIQWVLDRGAVVERDKDGRALRMSGVNIDVTSRVYLEKRTLELANTLKSIITILPFSVIVLDQESRVKAISQSFIDDFVNQVEVGEITDELHLRDLFPVLNDFWIERVEKALKGKTLFCDEEFLKRSDSDEHLWVRWKIVPWKNLESENVNGVIVYIEDISERKVMEKELNDATKFSALGQMASGIAHEINNPLSIIFGYVDLLIKQNESQKYDYEKFKNYLHKAHKTLQRMTKVISSMRRLYQESPQIELEPYSINYIVRESVDLIKEKVMNDGIEVSIDFMDCDCEVPMRATEVSQVFLNLIANSCDSIVNQGRPWIKIQASKGSGSCFVKVIDSGDKIPNTIAQKMFEPFYTTKEQGKGSGLGLSLSRKMIEDHEGELYYEESSPNNTFVIKLKH